MCGQPSNVDHNAYRTCKQFINFYRKCKHENKTLQLDMYLQIFIVLLHS